MPPVIRRNLVGSAFGRSYMYECVFQTTPSGTRHIKAAGPSTFVESHGLNTHHKGPMMREIVHIMSSVVIYPFCNLGLKLIKFIILLLSVSYRTYDGEQ